MMRAPASPPPGFFIGGVPQLKDTDLLYSRATDRKYLVTTGSGRVRACGVPQTTAPGMPPPFTACTWLTLAHVSREQVHIHIDVILKHMDQHGVEW